MRARTVLTALALALAGPAPAYGPWLEKTPIGGVELSDGWTRPQLDARLDEIAREDADRPFIVTRTKWLTTAFDHVRLAVNTNDLFVHWHADCAALPLRFLRKMGALQKRIPQERGLVCGWSYVDVSHTCPDWKSVLALGPRGLAERARRRRATARTDDERHPTPGQVRAEVRLVGDSLPHAEGRRSARGILADACRSAQSGVHA